MFFTLLEALGAKQYTLKDENVKKCIRMGITVLNVVIFCGGGEGVGVEIISFMVANCVLRLCMGVARKRNFRP